MAENTPAGSTPAAQSESGSSTEESRGPSGEHEPYTDESGYRWERSQHTTPAESHPLAKQAVHSAPGRRKRAARRARNLAERNEDSMPVVAVADGPRVERVVNAEMRSPAPKGGLIEALRRPYVLRLIMRRELAQKYSASVLGLFWSYVQPAMRFATYYFVAGVILHMHKDVPYFALHLFCGMVFVHMFTETWQGGCRSIWMSRALVKKMPLAREVFPLASLGVSYYHTLPQLLILSLLSFVWDWHLDWFGLASGALGLALVTVWGLALAILFSALNVFYMDFQNIVATITQFLHFLVPMLYPIDKVLQQAHGPNANPTMVDLYLLNPLAWAVMLLQRMFWYPVATHADHIDAAARKSLIYPPHVFWNGLAFLAVGLVFLVFCQFVFRRMEAKFPERI